MARRAPFDGCKNIFRMKEVEISKLLKHSIRFMNKQEINLDETYLDYLHKLFSHTFIRVFNV